LVAVEGASAAGKTTAVTAAARRRGWTALPEAYRRLDPPPSLEFRNAKEVAALERRLLDEEARRYAEARALVRDGATVLADTGFLGPLTYTWALVSMGATPRSSLVGLIDAARSLRARRRWGLPDAVVYLDTPKAVRAARTRRDPAGPTARLAARHAHVGDRERGFYRERLAPLLGPAFASVSGDASASVVARRLAEEVERRLSHPPTDIPAAAVLALFDEGGPEANSSRGNR
jgi:AAA domain